MFRQTFRSHQSVFVCGLRKQPCDQGASAVDTEETSPAVKEAYEALTDPELSG